MTNKKSAGNRVFMANLGKAGTFALNCGHRELKQIESLLGMKISELTMESVREIDCCLYCMVQRDAARKQVAMDKETFNAALDNMNAAQYLAASRAAAQCYRAAFDVPEDGEETEDTADGDEKNAPTTPADGTGTEAWLVLCGWG